MNDFAKATEAAAKALKELALIANTAALGTSKKKIDAEERHKVPAPPRPKPLSIKEGGRFRP